MLARINKYVNVHVTSHNGNITTSSAPVLYRKISSGNKHDYKEAKCYKNNELNNKLICNYKTQTIKWYYGKNGSKYREIYQK